MKKTLLTAGGLALTMFSAGSAWAQASPRSPLNDLGLDQLRSELDRRYNEAVQATQAADVIRADNARFLWASETKVQCGIAIGFTKHRIKDADSINKCDSFYARMNAAPPPPPPPPVVEATCPASPVVEVFFEWNVDTTGPEAAETIAQIARNRDVCGWGRIKVTGHTDTSGTNVYNDGLAMRRANNVAAALEGMGVARSDLEVSGTGEAGLKVETADGVREPANRRVEVIAQPRGN
jgi:outer membrane protein OmpA-like peptidoglycan-associated protein